MQLHLHFTFTSFATKIVKYPIDNDVSSFEMPHSPRDDVELNPKACIALSNALNSFVYVSASNRDGVDFLFCWDSHDLLRNETNFILMFLFVCHIFQNTGTYIVLMVKAFASLLRPHQQLNISCQF